MLQFFIYWLEKIFDVPREKLKVSLHLYSDMDAARETKFWSVKINLHASQFLKPYVKESKTSDLTRKGGFGHGTCSVRIENARLAEKVLLGLKVIRGRFDTGQ